MLLNRNVANPHGYYGAVYDFNCAQQFDALGGNLNQPMALAKKLESDGFARSDIATAINAALAAGVLIQVESGSIRKA